MSKELTGEQHVWQQALTRKLFRAEKEGDERMFEVLKELMADEINASVALGEARGKENGLKALVSVLKGMSMDFEASYQTIVQTEAYAGISRQQVMKYWK